MRQWYKRRQVKKLYRLAKKYDQQVVSNDWMLHIYRILRNANERLGV